MQLFPLKAVEEGKHNRALMGRHVWAGSGLFSRSARISSHFAWRASSVTLRTAVLASRYSVRFSCTTVRRLFHRLMLELWRLQWFGVSADVGFPDACFGSRDEGAVEPQDSTSQGDRFRGVSRYACVDSICKALPIHVLCVPSSASMGD